MSKMNNFKIELRFKKQFGLLISTDQNNEHITFDIPLIQVVVGTNVSAKGFFFGGFEFYD